MLIDENTIASSPMAPSDETPGHEGIPSAPVTSRNT